MKFEDEIKKLLNLIKGGNTLPFTQMQWLESIARENTNIALELQHAKKCRTTEHICRDYERMIG